MKRYFSLISWLLLDAFRLFPWAALIAVGLSVLRTAFQLGAGFVVYAAVRALENPETSPIPTSSNLHEEPNHLVAAIALVGVFLVLAAIVSYGSDWMMTRLQRRYEEAVSVEALNTANRLDLERYSRLPFDLTSAQLIKISNAYARFAAIAQRLLLRCIVPAMILLAVTATVALFDWIILLPVALFMVLAVLPFRFVTKKAMQISDRFEPQARAAAQQRTEIARALGNELDGLSPEIIQDSVRSAEIRTFLDTYEDRLNVSNFSALISALIATIGLLGLIVVFYLRAAGGEVVWSELILLIIALRFAFNALQQVVSMVTSLNRFHTQLSQIYALIEVGRSWGDQEGDRLSDSKPEFPIVVTAPEHGAGNLVFAPGERRFLVFPSRLGRFDLYSFLVRTGLASKSGVNGQGAIAKLAFNESAAGAYGATGSGETEDRPAGNCAVEDLILDSANAQDDEDQLKNLAASIGTLAPPVKDFVARALKTARQHVPIVFIDQLGMNKLSNEQAEFLLNRFSASDMSVYATKTVQPNKTWNIDRFVLFNGTRIAAIFDRDELAQRLSDFPSILATEKEASGDGFRDAHLEDVL